MGVDLCGPNWETSSAIQTQSRLLMAKSTTPQAYSKSSGGGTSSKSYGASKSGGKADSGGKSGGGTKSGGSAKSGAKK
jgi:hypothetical protein